MTRTKFEPINKEFSDKAHTAAQQLIYPEIFKCSLKKLEFETIRFERSERERTLDGKEAIDRIIRVEVEKLKAPLSFTVQERWRRMGYTNWKDLTITEWNYESNVPSELYKIKADLIVYGYYDEAKESFGEVIMVAVPDLKLALVLDSLPYTREKNKKKQSFLGFRFEDLNNAGLMAYWKKGPEHILLPERISRREKEVDELVNRRY